MREGSREQAEDRLVVQGSRDRRGRRGLLLEQSILGQWALAGLEHLTNSVLSSRNIHLAA